MENKIRNNLNEIYFGKTRDIVNGLRSVVPLSESKQTQEFKVRRKSLFYIPRRKSRNCVILEVSLY